MSTGAKIRKLREEANLSLRDLEKKINLDRTTIWYIEKDKKSLTVNNLIKICKFFGISSDYLLGLEEKAS